jgi:hypothetical protein
VYLFDHHSLLVLSIGPQTDSCYERHNKATEP